MPQQAFGDGPWGEGIRYWLNAKKLRQADLRRPTGLRANTISKATRGFDVTTRVLRKIALALKVTVEDVLVSPDRQRTKEDQRQTAKMVAAEAVAEFYRRAEQTTHGREEALLTDFERAVSEAERQKDKDDIKRPDRQQKQSRTRHRHRKK